MFGKEVNKTLGGMPSEKDLCTAPETTCQPGVPGTEPGAFTTPEFVAVDPTTGDVYVGDTGDNLVSKFSSSGVLEATWGKGGQLNGSSTPAGSFGELGGIAVSTTGNLLVYNTADHFVFEFEPAGGLVRELELKLEAGSQPRGLGVDAAGDLFKVDGSGQIEKFDSAGNDLTTVSQEAAGAAGAFTVQPAGDVYVAGGDGSLEHFAFNGSDDVIEPGGGGTCPPVAFGNGCPPTDSVAVGFAASGIAVASASGDTSLSNAAEGTVVQYGPLVTIPDGVTGKAVEVTGFTATLNGTVNPDEAGSATCEFEYGTSAAYTGHVECEEAGSKTKPVPGGPTDDGPVPVSAKLSGLTPGVTYHFRLVARNANDPAPVSTPNPGLDEKFETLPPPSITAEKTRSVTRSSAVLNAQIEPHGAETHYHFEYVEQVSFAGSGFEHATRVPACPVGDTKECEAKDPSILAGTTDEFVSTPITLEKADTTYYWRVVASNASGTTDGVDNTFVYPTAGEPLPDNRAYEMVTPAHKNGALIGDVSFVGSPPEIAEDGSRVIDSAIQCFAGAESCVAHQGDNAGSPYAFTRVESAQPDGAQLCAPAAPPCWKTTPLAPPATQFSSNASYGGDASTGVALFAMPTPISPLSDGEDDFYLREPETATEKAKFVDLGPNTPSEDGPHKPEGGRAGAEKQAHTADFSRFAWDSPARWPFDEGSGEQVYEYARLGSSQPLLAGVSGSYENGEDHNLIGNCETKLGSAENNPLPGLMSADGRTVFFTAEACPQGGLGVNRDIEVPVDEVYARVDGEVGPAEAQKLGVSEAHTVAISEPDAPQTAAESPPDENCRSSECIENTSLAAEEAAHAKGEPSPWGAAELAGASADGSRAFFTSTQQLTGSASEDPGDNAVEPGCAKSTGIGGCNLYEYDFDEPAGHELIDVSAGEGGAAVPGGPRAQGVMAISSDGSHVYFVAKGVLTKTANERGLLAQDGAENLYLFEQDAAYPSGRTVFIADLPAADSEEFAKFPGDPANVTPEGRYLVFLSSGRLTADDTSVSGAQQVFRYDAQTGHLIRISVGNDGFNDNGNRSSPSPCNAAGECYESARIAQEALSSSRSDPTMSDNGQFIFFQSPVALTPGALDDVVVDRIVEQGQQGAKGLRTVYAQNVYEWHEGHVYLISDGRDVSVDDGDQVCPFASVCLLGADVSGKNVFFTTADQLAPADTNTEVDIYDARVCEPEKGNPCVTEPPPPLAPCNEEACHGTPAAQPSAPTGGTLTFNGAGNQPPSVVPKTLTKKTVKCKQGKVRNKHRQCVKRKKSKRPEKSNRRPGR
jgi:hypothetical protein